MMLQDKVFLVVLLAFLGTPRPTEQRRIQRDLFEIPNSDRPRIYPDEKEVVVTSGRNLTLRCEGKEPITWDFPKNLYIDDMQDAENRISVSETPDSDYPYGLLLELFNLSYVDVGYYSCVHNTTDYTMIPSNELDEMGKRKRIYVYVDDPERLMVASQNVIFATQYTTITIPCRPTAPNVEVSLYQNEEKVKPGVKLDWLNDRVVTYNKYLGFTLPEVEMTDGSHIYECKFERNGKEESTTFGLSLSRYTESVPKPQINDSFNGNTVLGSEIHLDCFVKIDTGIAFHLNWIYPDFKMDVSRVNISETSTQVIVGANNVPQKIGQSTLHIKNVTRRDQGLYECKIIDANSKNNSDIKFITVLENGTSYIHLEEPAGYYNINVKAGNTAKWIISVDAFPIPQITWFDMNNNPITAGWLDSPIIKYRVITTPKDTQLRITKVTLQDSGVYQVMAENGIEKKFLNLTLNVKDKPNIVLETKKFYIHGKTATISCHLTGYPPPQVTWFFQQCIEETECKDVPTEQIPKTEYDTTPVNATTVTSVLTIPVERSGLLICAGANTEGRMRKSSIFYESDIENGFGITGLQSSIVEGDNVTLICSGSIFHQFISIDWYKGSNSNMIENSVESGIYVTHQNTNYSNQVILSIPQGEKTHNGQYICKTKSAGDIEPSEVVTLNFKDPLPPSIYSTNMDNKAIRRVAGEQNVNFYCYSKGLPIPDIKWYKDDILLKSNDSRVSINGGTLEFKFIKEEDSGKYSCVSKNRVSSDSRFVELSLETREFKVAYLATIIALAIFFIVLVVYLVWKIRKERKIRKELSIAGLLNFEEGATDSLNPELGIDEQADLLPYDKKWEFPREKLKLGKQLGSGAFGVVMKAEAQGIVSDEEYTKVAVKMVKKTAESAFIKALASELKIMVHLGKHLNVVNLLGACTKNVTKRELYVIVEYCRFGNIHNYLLRHRCKFIDQVIHSTDAIDSTIGSEVINRAYSVSSNKSGSKYAALPLLHSGGSTKEDFRDSVNSAGGMDTNNTVISMVPNGTDSDGIIMSNGSMQPEWRSNYRGDYNYNKDVRPISTQDLLCWSFQVARGMEYLANRKVLHGDLAARNILLADDNIVKICDFGLAKSMYKSDNYKKKGDGPLPVKWMAIESIRDRVFSTQSDVWSYGIVLWEIFSLASTPYPGMEADEKLFNKLVEGYRMEKPKFSNKQIYNTMLECWTARPVSRPTFTKLAERLGALLEDSVRKHYVDLNDPYVDMNNRWLAERGDSDYLAMMNSPDYGNVASSNEKHEYVNDPFGGPTKVNPLSPDDTDGEGYLCMSPAKNGVITSNPPLFDFSTPTTARRSKPNVTVTQVEAQQTELIPMLGLNSRSERPGSDSDLGESNPASPNLTQKPSELSAAFSNPSYQPMFKVPDANKTPSDDLMISKDNYVNMSQKDSGFCDDIDVLNPPAAFSNPSYVAMNVGNQKALPNIYSNMPNTVA